MRADHACALVLQLSALVVDALFMQATTLVSTPQRQQHLTVASCSVPVSLGLCLLG